ncbi:MAG: hypothetical protein KDH95_15860 [Calditrichaeota bacterium]|nr:hypothetical protein [Calditrichota bacterium]MCB0269634.1 hypothetical protein [Calditrichota bacterium]MCB9067058.1 hypothetical protein [Calditrichia bacterium]
MLIRLMIFLTLCNLSSGCSVILSLAAHTQNRLNAIPQDANSNLLNRYLEDGKAVEVETQTREHFYGKFVGTYEMTPAEYRNYCRSFFSKTGLRNLPLPGDTVEIFTRKQHLIGVIDRFTSNRVFINELARSDETSIPINDIVNVFQTNGRRYEFSGILAFDRKYMLPQTEVWIVACESKNNEVDRRSLPINEIRSVHLTHQTNVQKLFFLGLVFDIPIGLIVLTFRNSSNWD